VSSTKAPARARQRDQGEFLTAWVARGQLSLRGALAVASGVGSVRIGPAPGGTWNGRFLVAKRESGSLRVAGLCVADTWVEECVGDVHDEVCDHDEEGS
jgi:hypothetical protein